jgi:TPR repeat protein
MEDAMNRFTYILFLGVLSLIASCASYESKRRARADAGEAEAQYQLASMYWEGKVVDRDPNESLKWYQRAAEHGHREAQVRLAELYERGEGISQNYERASQWYKKATEEGDIKSEIRLAQLYLKGQGVPQNYAEARKLLEQAAAKKNAEGQYLTRSDLLGRVRRDDRQSSGAQVV